MATPSIHSFYTPALQRSIQSSLRSPSYPTQVDTHLSSLMQVSGSSCIGSFMPKTICIPSASSAFLLRHHVKLKHGHYHLLVAKSNSITATNSNGEEGSSNSQEANIPSPASPQLDQTKIGNGNNSALATSPPLTKSSSNSDSVNKRTPLTAREKLRAARVMSRYSETKNTSSKPRMGSKLLEALRESEKGKKGLPEAPTNMLDDGKRGMPKQGLTFDFPGGNDLLVIVFSFVFISTVMFATTFFVWKLGAIHFNE